MSVAKAALAAIVGAGNVIDDEATLESYSRDQSFVERRRPDAVVFAHSVEQVQEILRLANSTKTPVTPYSSGLNLHGAAIPDQGGILLNMSRMQRILEIDKENWFVVIEPGVTYRQLQDELQQQGFRFMVPFGVPPGRSVLTSYMERDTVLAAPSFENGNSLIMDTEIVLPTGEIFRTGNWTAGGSPGSQAGPIRTMIYRLWTGAQGTLGIVTKIVLQIEPLPPLRKIFFLPFQNIHHAVDAITTIQRREIGLECFLLNNFNAAALYTESWPVPGAFPARPLPQDEFHEVRRELPPFLLMVCLNPGQRHPEEKIAYEEAALKDVCDIQNIELRESLPGIPRSANIMLEECLRPWGILKKFNFRGAVHDITFKAPIESLETVDQTMRRLFHERGLAKIDAGLYILPLERGRGLHFEFDLHCNPEDPEESAAIKNLWLAASLELMNNGAYFDRPYGPWAEMVYSRAATYAQKLRQIKAELDPNNILNPGKLCL
jgi:hypothetical protein